MSTSFIRYIDGNGHRLHVVQVCYLVIKASISRGDMPNSIKILISLSFLLDKCLRILLVADPQIIGETLDKSFYNDIAIHDSDKYLKKTFNQALNYVQPDVICFMGDLMDEGSIANDDQFKRYLNRFQQIYQTYDTVQKIYIPGDNDIGGEGNDHVSAFKVNRFRAAYNETDIIPMKNYFRFININVLTRMYPEAIKENSSTSDMMNIVLSHISILTYPGLTMQTVRLLLGVLCLLSSVEIHLESFANSFGKEG